METLPLNTSIMCQGKPADDAMQALAGLAGFRSAGFNVLQFRDDHRLPLNEDGSLPKPGTAFGTDLDSIVVILGCYPLHSVEGERAMQQARQAH